MDTACPHCKQTIEYLSATEVVEWVRARGWDKFSQNYLSTLQQKGKFPQPWIAVGTRQGWLEPDLQAWWNQRESAELEKAMSIIAGLNDSERDKVLQALARR